MKKTRIKIGYDVLMLATTALLFGGSTFGMSFHEIAGLVLLAAFLVHLLLNRSWIAGAARCLPRGGTAGRLRLLFVLDALLLGSFTVVGVSGVMISRVLFGMNGGGAWRTAHSFSAALALILTGIHLGLHARLIAGALGGLWKKRGMRTAAAVCVLAVCVCGGYSLATTDFTAWLAAPFVSQTAASRAPGMSDGVSSATPQSGEGGGGPAGGEGTAARGLAGESLSAAPLAGGPAGAPAAPGGGNGGSAGPGGNTQQAPRDGGPGGAARGAGVLPALETIARFFSIVCVFATVTGLIDYAPLRRPEDDGLSGLKGSLWALWL